MSTLAQSLVWRELLLPEDLLEARPGSGSCHCWVLTGAADASLQPQNKPTSEKWRGPKRTVCKCVIESEGALANFRSLSVHSGETEARATP